MATDGEIRGTRTALPGSGQPSATTIARAAMPDSGVGRGYLGPVGVAVASALVTAALCFLIYVLIAVWPTSGSVAPAPSRIAGITLMLNREQRLFVVVGFTGALGGLIHTARSLYEYAGNRVLRRSWLPMYIFLPFIGAALAVVFYVILRGGLFTGAAVAVNFFGFAAISALVGLFSPEAAEKLKQLFSTLLAPAPRGRDSLSSGVPAVVRLDPESGAVGTPVTITGRNLSETTVVIFGKAAAPGTVMSDEQVTALVPAGATTGPVRLLVGDQIATAPREFSVPPTNLAPERGPEPTAAT
jgi:hypothetical protein